MLIALIEHITHLQPNIAAAQQRFRAALKDSVVKINPRISRFEPGRTLLHLNYETRICWNSHRLNFAAGIFPNHAISRVLLDAGMDVNSVDFMRNTALHAAAGQLLTVLWNEHRLCDDRRLPYAETCRKCVEILVRHGAHVDARNAQGRTALDHLAGVSQPGEALLGVAWLEDIFGDPMSRVTLQFGKLSSSCVRVVGFSSC